MVEAKKTAINWVDENKERIIEISDEVWDYAELGFKEFKSAKLLANELKKHGFKVEEGVGDMPTAFVGTWGSGKPVIGVMGEYDALPGLSQKKQPTQEPASPDAPCILCPQP